MRSVLLCVLALGCGEGYWPEELSVSGASRFRGLWTTGSAALAPEGSLAVADNVVLDEAGVVEPRRGFSAFTATLSGAVNRLTFFDGFFIAHHGSGSISRTSDGTSWTAYSGTFSPPDSDTRVTFTQAEGSLFVTTSLGVYELDDAASAWRLTGAPPALDSTATLRRTSNETGFATANGQWAYRAVWGIKNANGRLELGRTSGRFIVQNPANITATSGQISKAGSAVVTVSGPTHGFATGEYVDVTLGGSETNFLGGRFQVTVSSSTVFTYNDGGASFTGNPTNGMTFGFTSRNVDVAIPIPSGITTSHFVQVYRSAKSATATAEPNDNLGQVAEESPTNLEITAGTMTITDITPDELRGAPIYTTLRTEAAQKDRPPHCRSMVEFRGSMIYGCTHGVQTLEAQLLGVGGTTGMVSGDSVFFRNVGTGTDLHSWQFLLTGATTESLSGGQFKVYTDGSASQNIANTARSLVRACNAAVANTHLLAAYVSGDQEAPGRIRFYARDLSEATFTFASRMATPTNAYWAPMPPVLLFTSNVARAGSTVTVDTTTDHGFATGQQIVMVFSPADANFPNGTKTIASIVDANTFTYTESGSAVSNANSNYAFSKAITVFSSTDDDRDFGIMYSEPNEPWAVPLTNFYNAGTGVIRKLVANIDRVAIHTSAGQFELTGSYPFSVRPVDASLNTIAYDTAVALRNRSMALTDKNVVEVLGSVRSVSTPIDRTLKDLRATAPSDIGPDSFAVAYEEEGRYILFVPDAAGEADADQAYVYHVATGDWTRWTIDKATCAFVNPNDGKLYVGRSDGSVWKENKDRTFSDVSKAVAGDYYDTSLSVTINSVDTSANTITLASASGVSVGDSIYQAGQETETIITAINGSVLTVENVGDLGAGAATVAKAYTCTVQPLPFREPGLGQFVVAGLNLSFTEADWETASLSQRSSLNQQDSTPFSISAPVTEPGFISPAIDSGQARAAWWYWKLTTTRAREKWALESWELLWAKANNRSGR